MKARPILLVIITLVIGFVLGMLTSAQIRFNKLKPVRLFFSEERFREGFYNIIQPDEKQKAEIEQILKKYAKLNSNLQANFRKELDVNTKEMRKELDSKLTKEQLARLKEMDERRQKMIKQDRRNRDMDSLNNRNFRRRDHDMGPDRGPGGGPRPGEGSGQDGRQFPDGGPMPPPDRPPFPKPDTVKAN